MPRSAACLLLLSLLWLSFPGCSGSTPTAVSTVAVADGGPPPAQDAEVAVETDSPAPEPAADNELPAPDQPPPPALASRKIEGVPLTDRAADRAKYLPLIAEHNRQPPHPFEVPPSPLIDNKPSALEGNLANKVTRLRQWAGYLRGKKLKSEIQLAQMSEKEVSAMLLDEKNQELPPEAMFAQEEVAIALGFLPDTLDVKKMLANLVSAGVGAFYDPKSKYFVMVTHETNADNDILMRSVQEVSDEITGVHELTHAIQDQYFDLVKLLPPDAPSDQAGAIRALVEGDATFVMLEYGIARAQGGKQRPDLLAKGSGQELAEAMGASMAQLDNNPMVPESTAKTMKAAPRILTEELLFSYGQGFTFVYALHEQARRGGVKGRIAAVDAAFRSPPRSTEQILHPEKYFNPRKFDAPQELADLDLTRLQPALFKDYVKVGTDEMGEFRMRVWFEEIQRGGLYALRDPETKTRNRATREMRTTAETAAAGWDGCRITAYQKLLPDNLVHTVLTAVAEFDSAADAVEAARLFNERARQLSNADTKVRKLLLADNGTPANEPVATVYAGTFGSHAVLRQGTRVVYVQDAAGATAKPLADLLMGKTTAAELQNPAPAPAANEPDAPAELPADPAAVPANPVPAEAQP